MGVMDAPKDVWVSRLGLALKVESVVFMTFWFLAYTVKCESSAISTCGPIHNSCCLRVCSWHDLAPRCRRAVGCSVLQLR